MSGDWAEERVRQLAVLFEIPDGARYLNDCKERAESIVRQEEAVVLLSAVKHAADALLVAADSKRIPSDVCPAEFFALAASCSAADSVAALRDKQTDGSAKEMRVAAHRHQEETSKSAPNSSKDLAVGVVQP